MNWHLILEIVGVFCIIQTTLDLQLLFGNWLYKNHKNCWLRKIWWSEFDYYRNEELENEINKFIYEQTKSKTN